MEWSRNTVTKEHPHRRVFETYPCLKRSDGVTLTYHPEERGWNFVFDNGDGEYVLHATKRSPDGTITDTWNIDLTQHRRRLDWKYGKLAAREELARMERNLESAFRFDPSWPVADDRPVRHVRFHYGIAPMCEGPGGKTVAKRVVVSGWKLLDELGLGTWLLTGATGQRAVESALQLGFRHIDTAQMYGNETEIGAAVAASGVPRRDIFLTGKICHALTTPAEARASIDESLRRLRTDYLDLCLLHWPRAGLDIPGVLEMLTRACEEGVVRRVGVANFPIRLLRQAVEEYRAPLFCNQIEYHALLDQTPMLEYLRTRRMILIAHVPLARGRLVEHPALKTIAARHHATPAQVALKWLLDQDGVAAIPKAAMEVSQRENLGAMRLRLDDEDRAAIAALPKDQRFVNPLFAPVWD